jgi:hypothetical protein
MEFTSMPEPKCKMFGYISVFTNLKLEIAFTDVGNNRSAPFDDFGSFTFF